MVQEIGRIKWFGGYNSRTERINTFGFITRAGKPDLFVHQTQVRCPLAALIENALVVFEVGTGRDGKECAKELTLLTEACSPEIRGLCLDSDDPEVWLKGVDFEALTAEEVMRLAISKIENSNNRLGWQIVAKGLPDSVLLHPEARPLREVMPEPDRLKLYQEGIDLEHIVEEIETYVDEAKSPHRSQFWQDVSHKIEYGNALFEMAPQAIKKHVVESRYRDFLAVSGQCVDTPVNSISWSPRQVYKMLDSKDVILAGKWADDPSAPTKARMLAARAAEKAAALFYRSLDHEVEDISLGQLDPGRVGWKSHDLLLDGHVPVDVKNSRLPVNNSHGYVEHCVPRFKQDRHEREVLVAGVLSPYLSLPFIEKPDSIHFYVEPIRFLGSVRRSDIEDLEAKFSRANIKLMLDTRRVVPPWLFDYPAGFYADQRKSSSEFGSLLSSEWPSVQELGILGHNPIPSLLVSGHIPDRYKDTELLSGWQMAFCERVVARDGERLSLPALFLTILIHFLETVGNETLAADYDPGEYTALLYASKERKHPLGIRDPLNIIRDLCDTLQLLWQHRNTIRFEEFAWFRFNGLGLLQGKRKTDGELETILAYCGGRVEGKGKCGYSPLVMGRDETCSRCGRLVCPHCGYCSMYCPDCGVRMKSMHSKASGKVDKGYFGVTTGEDALLPF